jgi:hypothetical protein
MFQIKIKEALMRITGSGLNLTHFIEYGSEANEISTIVTHLVCGR